MSINAIGNLAIAPAIISPGANVTLTAGAETTIVATSVFVSGVPGMNYIPVLVGVCVVLMGATAPTALVIAGRYLGGADFDTQTIDTGLLVANATIEIPIVLIGSNIRPGAGGGLGVGTIQVTGLATTTAATARATSTKLVLLLIPGPDL